MVTYQRTVRAVKDLGIIKGATGPHIMECDDGRSYLVKFSGTPVSKKAAVNEFVGIQLARLVGLPTPEGAFVEVGTELVASSRDMPGRRIAAGVHQGSEMIPDVLDIGQFVRIHPEGRVENIAVLPQTICHDNLILTPDRDRDDNHLIRPLDGAGGGLSPSAGAAPRFAYVMVDFSHGFTGPDWTADSIEQGSYSRTLMPLHPAAALFVKTLDSFQPALGRIEGIEDATIEDIVAAIPPSWGLTDDERSCLSTFLELRRGLLRNILNTNRAVFPNWKD